MTLAAHATHLDAIRSAAAPAADMAVSPGSQPFNVAAGPVSAPSQAALQAPAPQPVAYVPPQAQVTTVFRLALIGEQTAHSHDTYSITRIMQLKTSPEAFSLQALAPFADDFALFWYLWIHDWCVLAVFSSSSIASTLLEDTQPARRCRAGPYVVPFDGKESAVMNAIAQVLSEYTKNVTVLSYTVGAPVAYGPSAAPSSAQVSSSSAGTRRRLRTTDGRCEG